MSCPSLRASQNSSSILRSNVAWPIKSHSLRVYRMQAMSSMRRSLADSWHDLRRSCARFEKTKRNVWIFQLCEWWRFMEIGVYFPRLEYCFSLNLLVSQLLLSAELGSLIGTSICADVWSALIVLAQEVSNGSRKSSKWQWFRWEAGISSTCCSAMQGERCELTELVRKDGSETKYRL
jgi:hypothetical protein